jgi:exosome complex component RRP42
LTRNPQTDTDILVGVKAELAVPSLDRPDRGRIIVHVERCSGDSSATASDERDDEDVSVALAKTLESALSAPAAFDLKVSRDRAPQRISLASPSFAKTLCIEPGVQCWHLHVDAMVFASQGNLADALSIAVYAALSKTLCVHPL